MELTLAKHPVSATTTTATRLSPKAAEDYQLVKAAIEGDQQAYSTLLDRYRPSVYNHLFKMVRNHDDAEDLTIEAFGKAFNKLSTYAPHYAFSTWLFKIAVNNCIDHIRKKRMHFLSIDQPMESNGDRDFTGTIRNYARNPEEEIIRQQRLQMVRKVLSQLSTKYRLMIELRYYEELSYEEIDTLMQNPGAMAYLESNTRAN
jgi:RNA polymerase sigma factor (sigma-70 family)